MASDSPSRETKKAVETEVLPNDPACLQCGKDVDEWVISFESTIHDEVGAYSKLHRCPHCNALCFADGYSTRGCFIFWVLFFPMCFVSFWLMIELTGEIKSEEDGVQGFDAIKSIICIILGGAGAFGISEMIGSFQKKNLRRAFGKRDSKGD